MRSTAGHRSAPVCPVNTPNARRRETKYGVRGGRVRRSSRSRHVYRYQPCTPSASAISLFRVARIGHSTPNPRNLFRPVISLCRPLVSPRHSQSVRGCRDSIIRGGALDLCTRRAPHRRGIQLYRLEAYQHRAHMIHHQSLDITTVRTCVSRTTSFLRSYLSGATRAYQGCAAVVTHRCGSWRRSC